MWLRSKMLLARYRPSTSTYVGNYILTSMQTGIIYHEKFTSIKLSIEALLFIALSEEYITLQYKSPNSNLM